MKSVRERISPIMHNMEWNDLFDKSWDLSDRDTWTLIYISIWESVGPSVRGSVYENIKP